MQSVRLFGLPLTATTRSDAIVEAVRDAWDTNRPLSITFVNPLAWTLARRDEAYVGLLDRMDMVLPDGIGVVAVARRLLRQPLERFSFDASSLYHPVMAELADGKHGLFVIGAAPGVAERACGRIRARYPEIRIVGCLDGFTGAEEALQRVREAPADMVLCGMGAPHQEKLLLALREAGFRGVAFTCGGFLDQLAQSETYYPAWIDHLELRWLWRIVKEPRRLFRRYALDYQPFVRLSLAALLTGRSRHGEPA